MTRSNVTPPGDTTAPGAAATPDPGATFSPGRFVESCSRAEALLQATGLKPTAIPRAVEGGRPEVNDAEVAAELGRRGIVVELPDPLPPLSEAKARATVRRQHGLAMPLHKLRPGRKAPLETGWKTSRPLTEDEATQWLSSDGGNIGTNPARCGENGWLMVDAENEAATKVFEAAGLVPLAYTAKSQHPLWPEKAGGAHFPVPIPEDVDPATLDNVSQAKLPGGGLVDLLFDTNCVLAGSRLDCAPGRRYVLNPDFHPELLGADVRWLFDKAVPLPEVAPEFRDALAALHGKAVKPVRTPRPHDPNSDRITQEIDDISWDTWIAGYEEKIQIIGIDGGCGCPVFHWWASGTWRSGILHEACEYGWAAHIYSATMRGELECPEQELECPEHLSRLSFRAYLEGRPHRLADVARGFGISLGDELTGFARGSFTYLPADGIAADIQRMAGGNTSPGLQVISGGGESNRENLRPNLSSVPRIGTVGGDVPAGNQAAPAPAPVKAPGAAENGTTTPAAGTDTIDDDPAADGDDDDTENTGRALFREYEEIDRSGFWQSLPILEKVKLAADTNGVGPWGLLGASLPRMACRIPPHVKLVSASGHEGGQNSGASLNLNTILTGAPEDGKSETIKLSQDLIPLPGHASPITAGTAEGVIKSFSYMRRLKDGKKASDRPSESELPAGASDSSPGPDSPAIGSVIGVDRFGANGNGYVRVEITDTVMLTAGEMGNITAELNRQGTKLMSTLRSGWVGEELGSTTGEIERRTYLAPHSYRLGAVVGAQVEPETLIPIFGEGGFGSPQRFGFAPATVEPVTGELPVRTIELPKIDWYDGEPAAAHVASLTGTIKPVWIKRPPAAHAEMVANREARNGRRHLTYSVTEVRRRARASEEERTAAKARGHELLHQFKIAAVLAASDGLREPTDPYWHAAGVIMHAREVLVQVLLRVLSAVQAEDELRVSRKRGKQQYAAKDAERQVSDRVLERACNNIMRLALAAAGDPKQAAYRAQVEAATDNRRRSFTADGGVVKSYALKNLSDQQQQRWDEAVTVLANQGFAARGAVPGTIYLDTTTTTTVPHAVPPANVS